MMITLHIADTVQEPCAILVKHMLHGGSRDDEWVGRKEGLALASVKRMEEMICEFFL